MKGSCHFRPQRWAARGLSRRVGIVVPNFLMVPHLLTGLELIAMLPTRCIPPDMCLAVFPPPLPVEGFRLDLAWHSRRSEDPVVMHVAEILVEVLKPGPCLALKGPLV
jgi:DNA-binding transcriptional LysR family regulator